MNKYFMILISAFLTGSLSVQGMLVQTLAKASRRVTQQGQRGSHATSTKPPVNASSIGKQVEDLERDFGRGINFFIHDLPLIDPVLKPEDISNYLNVLRSYASFERYDAPHWTQYKATLEQQQQQKE